MHSIGTFSFHNIISMYYITKILFYFILITPIETISCVKNQEKHLIKLRSFGRTTQKE